MTSIRKKGPSMKSTFMRIAMLSFLLLFFLPNPAASESKTFIKEYTYQASEADSKISSRAIALEQVKRLLLEELGTYIESHTEVTNFQLTKDQITALTAGIVQTQILNEKWDGERYWIKAKIDADPDKVERDLDALRRDREKSKELEDAKKKAETALKEVERLRKELDLSKKDQANIAKYDKAIKELSATDWYRKGLSFARSGNYDETIAATTKAIQLNPQYLLAYVTRSFAYIRSGKYHPAIADCSRAIELDPKNTQAYVNRGIAYAKLGDYKQVLADSNRAIELDPKISMAYVNRGMAYGKLGDHKQALADSNRAIELDPQNAQAYVNRGMAYSKLKYDDQAISNYKSAARLGNKQAQDHLRSKGISWQ
jgi:tetratricopeptide (TPR) repeat protein